MGITKNATGTKSNLGARWHLNASMLSRPADLSSLVSLSQSNPQEFLKDDAIRVLVNKLLNCQDERVSDKDTKLDVLAILANISNSGDARAKEEVRTALQSVSEWFDDYLREEQGDGLEKEPELHKSMLLLLARTWNYKGTPWSEEPDGKEFHGALGGKCDLELRGSDFSWTSTWSTHLSASATNMLKTEDLLELTRGDRGLALDLLVGVLEDGRTYATELVQSRKPSEGNTAQWEHELVCRRYEKPLVLQLCRLVRGFTHPASYFTAESDGRCNDRVGGGGNGTGSANDLALFSVDEFSAEMDSLLEITLRSRVIEKLSVALHACLFARYNQQERRLETSMAETHMNGVKSIRHYLGMIGSPPRNNALALQESFRELRESYEYDTIEDDAGYNEYRMPLEDRDHLAVHSMHIFIQNLFHYATRNTDLFRQHLLDDNLLVSQLILPYLDQCVRQARLLCHRRAPSSVGYPLQGWVNEGEGQRLERGQKYKEEQERIRTIEAVLAQGIASSLKTLIIASFRYPPNKFALGCLRRLNPTGSLLRARPFVARHDYIFALLCLLNVNMGALNMGAVTLDGGKKDDQSTNGELHGEKSLEAMLEQGLLDDMASVFQEMDKEAQHRVVQRVTHSGALPVSRDAPGYATVLGVLGLCDPGESGDKDGARFEWSYGAKDTEDKCSQEREDWAFDRNALKSKREERARKVKGGLPSAAVQNLSQGQSARSKGALPERVRCLGGPPAAEAKCMGLTKQTGVEVNKDPSALAHLKKQRVRVSLDLPSNIRPLSTRLELSRYDDGSRDGGRTMAPGAENGNGDGPARVYGDARAKDEIGRDVGYVIAPRDGRTWSGCNDKEDAHSVGNVPKEFLCAINGHMMKQPVRSPYGHVFEHSTILLWLECRGPVCPFTGNTLGKEDLVLDDELRTRVMRWHIQKSGNDTGWMALEGDDVHDF